MNHQNNWKRLVVILAGAILLLALPILFTSVRNPTPNHQPHQPSISVERVDNPPAMPNVLVAGEKQAIFHIDPTQSVASYSVDEILLGSLRGRTVVGVSSAITGEVLIDFAVPQRSQLGAITVNLEQLTSDSTLRDERLRNAYLESTRYPEARFIATEPLDFPEMPQVGKRYTFTLSGVLTLRETSIRTLWTVTVTADAARLTGVAETTTLLSAFAAGPINLAGLLRTEDEVKLRIEFVATLTQPSQLASAPPSLPSTTKQPTITNELAPNFAGEVQPILEAKCVACHTSGQIGAGLLPLNTVGDAVLYADDLAMVFETRYMPPWSPSRSTPPMLHDRSLSDDEMTTLLRWVRTGATVNTTSETRLNPVSGDQPTIRRDMSLSMPENYTPPTDRVDEYRCFLVDPKFETDRFITGYEIVPGNMSIVHHILVYVIDAATGAEALERDGADGRPGWTCFGSTDLQSGTEKSSIVPGWTPGEVPLRFPEGTGMKVEAGDLLVMQVHYNVAAGTDVDRSTLHLDLAEAEESLVPLQGVALVAPVEIPCPATMNHEHCTREAALRHVESYSPNDRDFADSLLVLCNRSLRDYATQEVSNLVSTCDVPVGTGGMIIQVSPHMHELGKSFHIELNPDTSESRTLLDIPHWDFDWQSTYTLRQPIATKPDDVLRITCVWDATLAVNNQIGPVEPKPISLLDRWLRGGVAKAHDGIIDNPYRYIVWGEGTTDEMCLGGVTIVPSAEFVNIDVNEFSIESNWLLTTQLLWMRALRAIGLE